MSSAEQTNRVDLCAEGARASSSPPPFDYWDTLERDALAGGMHPNTARQLIEEAQPPNSSPLALRALQLRASWAPRPCAICRTTHGREIRHAAE